jgi:hypothetical protein
MCGPGSTGSGEGPVAGFCEHDKFRFHKGMEFHYQLSSYQLSQERPWIILLVNWYNFILAIEEEKVY